MNEQQAFERIVAESVSDLGPLAPSDGAVERTITSVDRKRQRPRWMALIKEPPMRTNDHLAVGSPTVRVVAIMAVTMLLIAALAMVGAGAQRLLAADAIVVSPDGTGHYMTIGDAVAEAAEGDEILVQPGTYDESIVIDKDVTLRGDGDRDDIVIELSTELSALAQATDEDLPFALAIEGADATVENLTLRGEASRIVIRGGSPTLNGLHLDGIGRFFGLVPATNSVPSGVEVRAGSTATITDSEFSTVTVSILEASSPTVSHNVFRPGDLFIDGEGTDPRIDRNVIATEGSWSAITVFGAGRPTISENDISSESTGIYVRYGGWPSDSSEPRPTITGNTIAGYSQSGVKFDEGAAGVVRDNRLSGTGIGISLSTATARPSQALIESNVIDGTGLGMSTSGPLSPQLLANDIAGAQSVGLLISSESSPILRENRICGNRTNLQIADTASPDIDDSNEICEDAAE